MRVLILANNDVGLYKFRKELMERLVKEHEVYVSLPDGTFIKDIISLGCKFIPCEHLNRRGMNPVQELKLLNYYNKIIKEYKPDIVFTYTIKPNAYGGMMCAKHHVPYVVNITGLGTAIENEGPLQKVMITLYKTGIKKAQKVFFQNAENRDFMLKRGMVHGAYDMLPGSGVNLSQYQVLPYPSGDTVDFVFIARIMKEKGIDQYLDAAKVIREKYPYTRFHICGEYEQDYAGVLNELQEQGVIIYHGLVKDMVKMHSEMSCTVHPSYYPEGLSNVLLESCACGRPIITTNRAGCRELIDDGVNGYICNQKDSQDLIEKIEKFLSLSREEKMEMGLAGRQKAEKEFDRNIVVEKYVREIDFLKEKEK